MKYLLLLIIFFSLIGCEYDTNRLDPVLRNKLVATAICLNGQKVTGYLSYLDNNIFILRNTFPRLENFIGGFEVCTLRTE